MEKKLKYKFLHPLLQQEIFHFEEFYEKIVNKSYFVSDPSVRPFLLGTEQKVRKCIFCDRTNSEVQFKMDAHALPACLGNKIYFTLEECDICNKKFGIELENELGKMTFADRAFFGISKRKGVPKWANKKGSFSQTQYSFQDGFVISMGGPDDEVKVKVDNDQKEIWIQGPAKSYLPIQAIKSLLHSCWIFLDKNQRNRHLYLLDIILNKLVILPFHYYKGFLSDRNPQLVQFEVFEKITRDNQFSPLIISLKMGPLWLIWAGPNIEKKAYEISPLPEIMYDKNAPLPTLQLIKVNALDKKIDKKGSDFFLTFEKLIKNKETKVFKKKLELNKRNQKISLILRIKDDLLKIENLYLRNENLYSTDPRAVISGPFSSLKLVITKINNNPCLKVEFVPGNHSIDSVVEAMSFIEKLANGNSKLDVYLEDGNLFFSFCELSLDAPFDFNIVKFIAEKIKYIEEKLKTKIKYPCEPIMKEDLDAFVNTYNYIFFIGESSDEMGECSYVLDLSTPLDSIERLTRKHHNEKIAIKHNVEERFVFNQKIIIPACQITFNYVEIINRVIKDGKEEILLRYKGKKCLILS